MSGSQQKRIVMLSSISCSEKTRIYSVFLLALSLGSFFGCFSQHLPVNDRHQLARQFYQEGKLDRAAHLYTTFITHNPHHPLVDNAILSLGLIYFQQGNYQRALFQFEKIMEEYPTSLYYGEALLGQAKSSFHLRDYVEAMNSAQEYLHLEKKDHQAEALILTADSYFNLKEYQKALEYYTLLCALLPKEEYQPETLYQMSLCQLYGQRYKEAEVNLTALLQTEYGLARRAEIYSNLAKIHRRQNLPLEALNNLVKARLCTEDKEMVDSCEQEINTIVQGELNEEQLLTVIDRYQRFYPADLALIRLGYLGQEKQEWKKAQERWGKFLADFSNHERKGEITKALKGLKEPLKVSQQEQGKLGCLMPISGDLSVYGDRVIKGVKLALEEYNARLESEIQLVIVDSQGNPELAKNGLKLLVEQEQVIAIIGPLLSSVAYELAPLADEYRVCILTPTATGKDIPGGNKYFFRNCLTNFLQGKAIASHAVNTLKLKHFGILYPDNQYGTELMKIFADEVERLGGQIEIIEFYEEGETDFRGQLRRINLIHPEALFVPGYPEEIVLIAPQLLFYSVEVKRNSEGESETAQNQGAIQLLGCDGWYSEKVITHGGKYVEGAVFTTGFCKEGKAPHIRAFVEEYQRKYGLWPDLLAAQAYDTTAIILQALEKCEQLDRESLRRMISEVKNFPGVTGLTSFSPSGEAIKDIPIIAIEKHKFISN